MKSPVKPSGLCKIVFFKWEDVLNWPVVDPDTGILSTAIDLKAGKSFYIVESAEKNKIFSEEAKNSPAGPFMDMTVTAQLGGSAHQNILSLKTMMYHQWGLIVYDRDGNQRLIGNKDSGATFTYDYTSGDTSVSRIRKLKWIWQNENSAPIYSASSFTVAIGDLTVDIGSLTFLLRFQVGHMDALGNPPVMNDAETTLTGSVFANKRLLVIADGVVLPCDDGSGDINWTGLLNRHIIKTLASNTIEWFGAVRQDEIFEIYAID